MHCECHRRLADGLTVREIDKAFSMAIGIRRSGPCRACDMLNLGLNLLWFLLALTDSNCPIFQVKNRQLEQFRRLIHEISRLSSPRIFIFF